MVDDKRTSSELQRLATLEATGLLDSPAERVFDRFTRLASKIAGTPVALVSLVDSDRQFFKSSVGLPEPWAGARQTPLSHSFCKHSVASGAPLVVADARRHPLLRDNLAIPELGVVAYLGIPLTTTQDHALGTLCVIDAKPREWTSQEVEILTDLAALVMTEIELRLLAKRLQRDYLELRSLELHRDETVQMLVHDLRNPLTSFLGGLELTQQASELTGRQSQFLDLARRGGETLLKMVDSILEVSKAEAGRLELNLAQADPAQILEAACELMVPLAENSKVRLSWEAAEGPLLTVDAEKLRRVLVNLVSNAIHHTPPEGQVIASARAEEGDAVRFSVTDTGCGIAPDAFEKIFHKYGSVTAKRIKAERASGASTGLGLPFSRMVVEAHGGRIWVESELGSGTGFHITMPMQPRLPLAHATMAAPAPLPVGISLG